MLGFLFSESLGMGLSYVSIISDTRFSFAVSSVCTFALAVGKKKKGKAWASVNLFADIQ